MYKCFECGNVFHEPARIFDDPSPGGVSLARGCYVWYVCPYCGEDDIDEVPDEELEEDEDE